MNNYQDEIISFEPTLPTEIFDLLFPIEIVTGQRCQETVSMRSKDLVLDEHELAMSAFADEIYTETSLLQTITCLLFM